MSNLMENLGTKIGAEFKAHRLRIETVESIKVDKISGKGLSTEDYTTAEKSKLSNIEAGAQVNTVASVAGKTGAVSLAKSDVGLENVTNESKATMFTNPTFTGTATGTFSGALSGNASTATTLQTARTINDISFNGSANISITEYVHSNRDFTNGTLITTSIDYSMTSGDPFILEIKGNSYGSGIPFDIQLQGYIYSDTIINYGGWSVGPSFNIIAQNVGGKLCFWFARQAYWQGFNVNCYTAYQTRATNKVVSITDVVDPVGTKRVTFTPKQVLRDDNYNSYAPTLTGTGASGTWGINISGNSNTATTADNGVVASSNATNGYVKLGNGTIIQWMTWTDNGQWTTRSFPIAFPNACTGISFTPSSGGDSISTSVVTIGSGFSKSSFREGFSGGNGWTIRMIAIGY